MFLAIFGPILTQFRSKQLKICPEKCFSCQKCVPIYFFIFLNHQTVKSDTIIVCQYRNLQLLTVKYHTILNGKFSLRSSPNWGCQSLLKTQLACLLQPQRATPSQNTYLSATLPCCARELTANLVFCSWATFFSCKCRPANLIFNWSSVHLN